MDNMLRWKANLIRGTGAIMGIDVLPIGDISLKILSSFANECQFLNSMNLSVLVRFAPDLNGLGSGYVYQQSRIQAMQMFRNLSFLIRNVTNDTAMVWSPAPV